MGDDDKRVVRLRGPRKPQLDEHETLKVVKTYACPHTQFLLDDDKGEVECAQCGEKMNPMFVLKRIAHKDRNLIQRRDALREEVRRLADRVKYKCASCGTMNDVSKKLRFRAKT